MSIATILAQTQAAEFTLHILRGRCAARPDHSPFLADEAAAFGDGAVFRVIREVQERYFRPPELIPGGSGKYGGRVAYRARRPRPAANGVLAR